MEFIPNWASKTTRNRLVKIESFAEDFFDYKVTRRCPAGMLNIHFGQSTPGHDLSIYMKELLLTRVGNYVVGEKAAEYYFSWNNLLWAFIQAGLVTEEQAREITGLSNIKKRIYKNSISICLSVFETDEKQAKMFFDLRFFEVYNQHLLVENAEYTEDAFTGRMKADFQNKSKVIKARYFKNWWDVDAEACSFTLIHQHLINNVLPWWGTSNDVVIDYKVLPLMYQEKELIRNHFSKEWEVPVSVVKEILASVMFDCKLVRNSFSGVWKILQKNHLNPDDFFDRAEKSVLLQSLIKELRNAWPKLMVYWNRNRPEGALRGRQLFRTKDKLDENGNVIKKGRFRPASFRAAIYFELERKMLSAIRLNFNQPVIHLMHDGFFCKHKPDIQEIKDRVLAHTGFDVNFSLVQY